jgi:hypothetical protein
VLLAERHCFLCLFHWDEFLHFRPLTYLQNGRVLSLVVIREVGGTDGAARPLARQMRNRAYFYNQLETKQ